MAQAATPRSQPVTRTRFETQASKRRQEIMAGMAFISPAFIILFVFLIVPMIAALYFSLTNWNGVTPLTRSDAYEFVGLENYQRILLQSGTRQEAFFTSLKNTVYFVLGVVPVQTLLAMSLAVLVNQRWLKGKGFFRTTFYFPSISSSVVISLIFMWMFNSDGIVNQGIRSIFPAYQSVTWLSDSNGILHNLLGLFGVTRDTLGEFGRTEIASISIWDWLSGPSVTMLTIMILNTWTTIGTLMVVFLAALQNIPAQVYEAAYVDGATTMQIFRKITVPLLRPTTFFVVTLGLIGTFQVFDQIYVISSGGPADTTLTIAYLVYRSGFKDQRMGIAAATAIVLFLIIFVFTLIQRRITGGDRAA
ncbi:MAG: sugar ABC transporter permease [Anaerolineae bacterium]|nr:sugar ABC transporter permease [Anaerolineae bacterium]